jgi:hypothetical protein
MALFGLGAIWGVLFSWAPTLSLLHLPALVGAPAALAVGFLASPSLRSAILWGLWLGALINAGVALWQKFILFPQMLANPDQVGEIISTAIYGRPLGLFGSPDLLAAMSLAGLAAAAGLWAQGRGLWPLWAASGALSLWILALARSHGAFLALGVGLAFLVGARIVHQKGALGKKHWVGIAVGTAGLLGIVLAANRGVSALAASSGMRLLNWKGAMEGFLHHPVQGVGLGRFAASYAVHRVEGSNETLYAHSLPLQILVELGVGGTALWMAAALLLMGWMIRRRGARWDLQRAFLAAAAAALWMRCAIDYDAQIPQAAAPLALITGLFLGRLRARDDGEPSLGRRNGFLLLALSVLFAISLGGLHLFRHVALAPFQPWTPAPTAADGVRLDGYCRRMPGDISAQMTFLAHQIGARARCQKDCGALDRDIDLLLGDLQSDPHPPASAWVLQARVLALRGDHPAMHVALDRALSMEPGLLAAHLFRLNHPLSQGQNPLPAHVRAAQPWAPGMPKLLFALEALEPVRGE